MKIDVNTFAIEDYLGKEFECDCQRTHTTRLETVSVQDHVDTVIIQYCKDHGYHTLYMIEDENTKEAYGQALEQTLINAGFEVDTVCLEKDVVPNEIAVFNIVLNLKRKYDYILGVGSGTLNDLSKFISHKLQLDYGIVATAPSMDGFASVGAALITDDLKTTYDCHVPTAIFGDLDVLCQAPIDMIKAGLGDIVGKYNCLVDWKMSHIINDEYYCQTIVDMVYKSIKEVVDHADGVLNRDKAAIKAITEALIETGMAMGFVGNSRPASGSEHHVSHYWEMKFLFAHHAPVFHGAKVGLATPGIIALWKMLGQEELDFEKCKEKVAQFDQEQWKKLVCDRFEGASQGVLDLEEKAGKNNIENALQRIDHIQKQWPLIQEVIEKELPDPVKVVEILKSVEAPYCPSHVDISDEMVKDSLILAKEVRVRYGLLQLLWDLGLLEEYSDRFVEFYRGIDAC